MVEQTVFNQFFELADNLIKVERFEFSTSALIRYDGTHLHRITNCLTDKQDLTAQHRVLIALDVPEDRIYTDHGLAGHNRARPGSAWALAAVRAGETLVMPKLGRLARQVPDAGAIADELESLALGKQVWS